MDIVIGVDGGNSKTDVAVSDTAGRVLTLVHGPGSSPAKLGTSGAADVIEKLIARALEDSAIPARVRLVALAILLAGIDLPEEHAAMLEAFQARYPGVRLVVDNDTTAVLMAGTRGAPGVAVVCGAGINACGLSPWGESAGFLSLGQLSGDWGGGLALGRKILWSAVRSEDGRSQRTALEVAVLEHFGMPTVIDVVLAIYRQEITTDRLGELVPALFVADDDNDHTARLIVVRLAHEVAVMARVMIERCGLLDQPAAVVLAGGVLTSGHNRLLRMVDGNLAEAAPGATTQLLNCRPVAGSLVSALKALPGTQADVLDKVADRIAVALRLTVAG